ncbi:hypothetical protein BJ170DRAFT_484219 [Xylariales sp. AK1849]|nr:hypothetical protein BJ170DRAFT_484219 [Xylariales sp. AK1849]
MPDLTPSGRVIWDDQAHVDVLIAMWDVVKPTVEQWELIMTRLETMGFKCTEVAVQQHLMKLRKKDGGSGTTAAQSTPKPRKTAAPKSGSGSGKRSRKDKTRMPSAIDLTNDDDDDVDVDEDIPDDTPSKKRVKTEDTRDRRGNTNGRSETVASSGYGRMPWQKPGDQAPPPEHFGMPGDQAPPPVWDGTA